MIHYDSNHRNALSKANSGINKVEKSNGDDHLLKRCVEDIYKDNLSKRRLKEGFEIRFDNKISPSIIKESLIAKGVDPLKLTYLSHISETGKENTIMPDGGFVYIYDIKTSKVYPILASEQKRQGTNDTRLKEGKKTQAIGNAIERCGKNFNLFRDSVCKAESVVPYVVFCQGCDFEKEFIKNKIRYCISAEINKKQLFRDEYGLACGYWNVREKTWSKEEITNILNDVIDEVFKHYKDKYDFILD